MVRLLNRELGFTLAELLIALAILGVIATFTIPKILSAQQDGQKSAKAKEVAAMVSAAYNQYRQNNTVSASTTLGVLTPYLNYVAIDTTSSVDDHVGVNVNYVCNSGITCLKMHGGGTFFYLDGLSFGGTNTTNGIYFFYDPDGLQTGGASDAPGKSACFYLYYNGRLSTRGTVVPGSADSGSVRDPGNFDPSWFSW